MSLSFILNFHSQFDKIHNPKNGLSDSRVKSQFDSHVHTSCGQNLEPAMDLVSAQALM